MNKDLTLQERITVLEDLHRPLEEHWAVRSKYALDARNSDFIYKHHVTRLEDIYANQKFEVKEPPQMFVMSPVSQLYGVNGIKTNVPGKKEKKKQLEDKWVDNFQKYQFLKDSSNKDLHNSREKDKLDREKERPPKKTLRPTSAPGNNGTMNSTSPNRGTRASLNSLPRHREETDYESDGEEKEPGYVKKRNHGKNLTKQELIMLGMYRLNSEQEEIYNKFVQMLSEFDAFDMENIVLDALHDAQSDNVLDDYGGTDYTEV